MWHNLRTGVESWQLPLGPKGATLNRSWEWSAVLAVPATSICVFLSCSSWLQGFKYVLTCGPRPDAYNYDPRPSGFLLRSKRNIDSLCLNNFDTNASKSPSNHQRFNFYLIGSALINNLVPRDKWDSQGYTHLYIAKRCAVTSKAFLRSTMRVLSFWVQQVSIFLSLAEWGRKYMAIAVF